MNICSKKDMSNFLWKWQVHWAMNSMSYPAPTEEISLVWGGDCLKNVINLDRMSEEGEGDIDNFLCGDTYRIYRYWKDPIPYGTQVTVLYN